MIDQNLLENLKTISTNSENKIQRYLILTSVWGHHLLLISKIADHIKGCIKICTVIKPTFEQQSKKLRHKARREKLRSSQNLNIQ